MDSNNFEKLFTDEFNNISYRHNRVTVWSDFVEMAACSISNAIDKSQFDEREKQYLNIAKKYSDTDLQSFKTMLDILVNALTENQNQDFLGKLFMSLEFGSDQIGQYFTPYSVAELAAKLNFSTYVENSKLFSPIKIGEPACGSGGMLIAFMHAAKEKGINYQQAVIFSATDLDKTAALMCYVQLSLLGCAGTVTVGDSLTGEEYSKWYTPFFFHATWDARRKIEAAQNVLDSGKKVNEKLKSRGIKTLFDFCDLKSVS